MRVDSRIGYPVAITWDGRPVQLLVRSKGKGGRITIAIEHLDKPPPSSEDARNELTTTESRAER